LIFCKNKISILGDKNTLKKFKKEAIGPDLLWKNDKTPYLSKEKVPFSFQSISPITYNKKYDEYVRDQELKNWGTIGCAFDIEFLKIDNHHILYQFESIERPPTALIKKIAFDQDLKVYLSYVISDKRRGRMIYFHYEMYAAVNNQAFLTSGRENFSYRKQLWFNEYYENHLDWIEEMERKR
jgi:hypothetical protein